MSTAARPRREERAVLGYVPLVENMPSGSAIRPGDRAHDAQRQDGRGAQHRRRGSPHPRGRALRSPAEDKPDAVIDLATLTGACVGPRSARESRAHGHRRFVDRARWRAAAGRVGRVGYGRCPLPAAVTEGCSVRGRRHEEHLARRIRRRAHSRSVPQGVRGRRSVGAPRHRGPRPLPAATTGYLVRGGTGFGVRTLIELASSFAKPLVAWASADVGDHDGRADRRPVPHQLRHRLSHTQATVRCGVPMSASSSIGCPRRRAECRAG